MIRLLLALLSSVAFSQANTAGAAAEAAGGAPAEAAVVAPPGAAAEAPAAATEPFTAASLEREVERIAAAHGGGDTALWPGFDPLAVPLAVYDGARTTLFRHPSPPPEFRSLPGSAPPASVFEGRYGAMTANTSAEIGGVTTATVLLDRPNPDRSSPDPSNPDRSLTDLAALCIHEAFHVYQRTHHPTWGANEANLFVYPVDDADLLALRRLETAALARALGADRAGDGDEAACWARAALAFRADRFARMDSIFAAYERGTERNEGLATYVEMRAAGRRNVDLPAAEFGAAQVRQRAYSTGSALAILLERFVPGWPSRFESDDRLTLDGALADALDDRPSAAAPAGERSCTFPDSVVAGAGRAARVDVAALQADRERHLAAFEHKPGWRIIVETDGGEPLWPQGFDPLNVQRIDASRVLHARFLRLGNGAGKIEILNAEALTEAAGSHPIFQGIRRVEVAGLAEPEVREESGIVSVRAPGVNLQCTGATLERGAQTIVVRLASN